MTETCRNEASACTDWRKFMSSVATDGINLSGSARRAELSPVRHCHSRTDESLTSFRLLSRFSRHLSTRSQMSLCTTDIL